MVSLPVGLKKKPAPSPTKDALALIQALDAQLATRDGVADAGSLETEGSARGALRRDIFSADALRPKPVARPTEERARQIEEPPQVPDLEVMAILVDGHLRQAVISGRAVAEGDSVGGYWVIEITPESILLWNDDGFKTLTWGKNR